MYIFLFACNTSGSTTIWFEKSGDTASKDRIEDNPFLDDTADIEDGPTDEPEEEPEEFAFGEYWVGSRNVYFDTCEGRLEEVGIRVIDPNLREEFETLCSACIAVYQVVVTPPFICGNQVPIAPTVWRGIILRSDNSLGVYSFSNTNQGYEVRELAIAQESSGHWVYQYESTFQSFAYTVEGMIFFSDE